MSDMETSLRQLTLCDKEFKATALTVTDTPQAFSSQLVNGHSRKAFHVYNISAALSGECYYGHSDTVSASTGWPIPKGADVEIPVGGAVGSELAVYFVADAGEQGDLRIFEGA